MVFTYNSILLNYTLKRFIINYKNYWTCYLIKKTRIDNNSFDKFGHVKTFNPFFLSIILTLKKSNNYFDLNMLEHFLVMLISFISSKALLLLILFHILFLLISIQSNDFTQDKKAKHTNIHSSNNYIYHILLKIIDNNLILI